MTTQRWIILSGEYDDDYTARPADEFDEEISPEEIADLTDEEAAMVERIQRDHAEMQVFLRSRYEALRA